MTETADPKQPRYGDFVAALMKPGIDIIDELTPHKAELWHCATLLAGEAGETSDAIKRYAIYDKPLDRENLLEELGDLEFSLQMAYNLTGFTREEAQAHNRAKLAKRYASGSYSNKQAQDRADKA